MAVSTSRRSTHTGCTIGRKKARPCGSTTPPAKRPQMLKLAERRKRKQRELKELEFQELKELRELRELEENMLFSKRLTSLFLLTLFVVLFSPPSAFAHSTFDIRHSTF